MTATHLILFASLAGAALFFAAGVALAALRPRRLTDDNAPTDVRTVSQFAELTQLRDALAAAEATVRTQATAPREAACDTATSVGWPSLSSRASRGSLPSEDGTILRGWRPSA